MDNTKKKKHIEFSATLTVLFAILVVYTIVFFVPILWAIFTTFKDYNTYRLGTARKDIELMLGFNNFTTQNLIYAFTEFKIPVKDDYVSLLPLFSNSVLYAGGCAFINTIVPCIVSYLVARYNYPLGKIIYGIVLVTMAIPIVGSLPSEIAMVDNLGLMDSLWGLYVLKSNFLGIYFLVFYAQFKSIPKDYTEAAEIDGASDMHIMLKIIFPIAIGTITTVMLLNFIAFWNDYQIPMIYWESHPVVAFGMYYFVRITSGQMGATPVKLAAMTIVALPIIALFLIFNKKIMSNMSIGGVKG